MSMQKDGIKAMNKLMRLGGVKEVTGLSRSSIYLFMEKNQFPKQIKIGARAVAWDELEIADWIAKRKQATQYQH